MKINFRKGFPPRAVGFYLMRSPSGIKVLEVKEKTNGNIGFVYITEGCEKYISNYSHYEYSEELTW